MQTLKKEALESLRGRWLLAICITLLSSILSTIGNETSLFSIGQQTINNLTNFFHIPFHIREQFVISIGNLASILFSPITIASSFVLLSLIRDEENITFSSLFQLCTSRQKFFYAIGLYILVSIFTWLWTLLFVIPGIIKSFSYSQTYFIWKGHPELSFREAITASRHLMDGYKLNLFFLKLSFIGWGILSLLTLGIGLIWLIPYYQTTMAAFYNNLIKDESLMVKKTT